MDLGETPEPASPLEASIQATAEPARPGLLRLSAWCAGVFLLCSLIQGVLVMMAAGVAFAVTRENPFAKGKRYREVWQFENMPPDDSGARAWFREHPNGKPAVLKRKGRRLDVEYNWSDGAGPQRPPWEQLGYAKAYLQSSSDVSGAAAKIPIIYGSTIGFVLAAALFSRKYRRWPLWPKSEGRSMTRLAWIAAGAGAANFSFALLYIKLLGAVVKVPEPQMFAGLSAGQLVWIIPAIVIIGPLAEEIVFRRVMFGRFLNEGWPVAGIAVTSLLFGLAHGSFWLFPMYFGYGVVFSLLLWKSDDLRVPIMAHAANNLAASLFMLTSLTW